MNKSGRQRDGVAIVPKRKVLKMDVKRSRFDMDEV